MSDEPDLSKEDFSNPRSCEYYKKQHDECFHRWLRDKFLNGNAKEDDCKVVWNQYESCIRHKLKALNLSHLKRESGEKPPIDVFELDLHNPQHDK